LGRLGTAAATATPPAPPLPPHITTHSFPPLLRVCSDYPNTTTDLTVEYGPLTAHNYPNVSSEGHSLFTATMGGRRYAAQRLGTTQSACCRLSPAPAPPPPSIPVPAPQHSCPCVPASAVPPLHPCPCSPAPHHINHPPPLPPPPPRPPHLCPAPQTTAPRTPAWCTGIRRSARSCTPGCMRRLQVGGGMGCLKGCRWDMQMGA